MSPIALAIVVGVLAFASLIFSRANEVCAISVRGKRLLVVRGRVPPALYTDLASVLERAPIERATVRIVKEGGKPRLLARGVPAADMQRLRNVVGTYPHRMYATAPRPKHRNLGQRLGIVWLAWFLHDRSS